MNKMDNIHLETRKRQLDSLKHFIFSSVEKTNSIINFMGWDASKVLEVKHDHKYKTNQNNVNL